LHAFKEKVTSKVIVGFWKRSLDRAKEYKDSSDTLLVESDYEDFEVGDVEC